MQNKNKKKICLIVSSLGKGGAERSAGLLSIALHQSGHDVTLVTVLNHIEFDYQGRLINLGELKDKNDSFFGRIERFLKFRKLLSEERFDYIIDSRSRISPIREQLISKFLYRSTPVIYIIRSAKLKTYLGTDKRKAKKLYSKAYQMVAVSKTIAEKVRQEYGLDRVVTIYNPVEVINVDKTIYKTKADSKYVLFFGRLDNSIKNISMLIDAYVTSDLPAKYVDLYIMGDGPDLEFLKNHALKTNCGKHIKFLPFNENPFPVVSHALFTLLTSHYEGLPRSVIESLACGVPVISTDYEGGPEELINPGYNGLIVQAANARAFADAMNRFIFDKSLYNSCRSNAKASVAHLSLDKIAEEWAKLLT
ncbi:MAG: glycosyltransferase [Flavobacteriaceae bacterium]|nr:glycosyltransferase [Flavobacteriaceae bacterium]